MTVQPVNVGVPSTGSAVSDVSTSGSTWVGTVVLVVGPPTETVVVVVGAAVVVVDDEA